MTKNEKKYLLEKLKKAALVASSVVTGLTVGGCEVSNKKDEAVANNNIVFIDEQTDATTSTIESTETTTTFKPINTDIHRRKYVDGNDSSSDTEYVETSYENDLITSSTTVTSTKNSNNNVVTDDNTTTYKTTTRHTSKTSPDTDKTTTHTTKTTKTTTKTTKTTPDTTKTTTSKTTTRPTTSKTTTTVTTTTEVVTEPPVIEYNIDDISYNADAFKYYADMLSIDLRTDSNGNFYEFINLNGNYTNMYLEGRYLLALLNYGAVNDDVIASAFSEFNDDTFRSCINFLYSLGSLNSDLNINVYFDDYSCNSCKYVGQYANIIKDNYINNNMEEFISHEIDDGNIEQRYYDSLAIKCLLGGYGNGYLYSIEFDNCMYDFNDYLSQVALGKSLKF